MRIFLTGATGFIGSLIVRDLLGAGHQVLGLTRSDSGAQALVEAGAEPHRGALEDLESLRRGAAQADAVIHTAFDHDFSNFQANCEKDQRAIRALGGALAGSDRPLVITSGTGMGSAEPGSARDRGRDQREQPQPPRGVRAGGPRDGGGRRQGGGGAAAAGARHAQGWPGDAVRHDRPPEGRGGLCGRRPQPLAGGARVRRRALYRLAVEQGRAGERFHAVAEEGVPARDIAAVVGQGLGVPVVSLSPEQAMEHFGWLGMFVGMDLPASSAWTRERLGWRPMGPGLIADLRADGLQRRPRVTAWRRPLLGPRASTRAFVQPRKTRKARTRLPVRRRH